MSYCERYFKLKAEKATPIRPTYYDAKISALRVKLGALDPDSAGKATDPQTDVLAGLTGLTTEEIQTGSLC